MSPWLFTHPNVYMGGVVQKVNAMVLGKDLKLLRVNGTLSGCIGNVVAVCSEGTRFAPSSLYLWF